uniref:MISP family member 3 n=1 Tax=Gopherus evgoodei TaxID=1825980 RepID=A0A8C4Y8P4_9SAUR
MTPIEREIRLHQEREETLRRQRGMASPRSTQEYVEVRMKPILSQAQLPAQLPKDKERQWAGAQMQREIQRERLREEDLMHMGQVRGTYDRGTPQELQEKKMLFEHQPSPEDRCLPHGGEGRALPPLKRSLPVSAAPPGARPRARAEESLAVPGERGRGSPGQARLPISSQTRSCTWDAGVCTQGAVAAAGRGAGPTFG